ncbi:MAG: hypothetical protein ACXABG_08860 [Promethearchaeota archaeon]
MPKKHTCYFVAVFCIVFLTIAGVNVKAHPPQGMSLVYDSNTNNLEVSITHATPDNTTHYVFSIVVRVNGSIDQSPVYGSQPDLSYFVYNYTVVTKEGYYIQVTAQCNEGGSITRSLGTAPQPPGGDIPGYMGIYLVIVVSVISFLALYRTKLKKLK